MTTPTIYLCIFRNVHREKIAEQVMSRVPAQGAIVKLDYLDTHEYFTVVREIQRIIMSDHVMVTLEVKPIETNPPGTPVHRESKTLPRYQ